MVTNAWNKDNHHVPLALRNVKKDSVVFNKEVFGNIFEKKRQLEARLRGIQRSLERVDSASLCILQKELLVEYETILFSGRSSLVSEVSGTMGKVGESQHRFFPCSNGD